LVRIGGGLDKVETDTPVKSRDHTDHSEYGVGAGLHGRARGGSSTGPTGPSLNWMLNAMNGVELARRFSDLALIDQSLKRDRLFPIVDGNSGVAVVTIGALTGDFSEYRVPFDDMERKPFGSRENSQNNVVCLNDSLQSPGLIVGRADEIAGLGGELPQLFEFGHLTTPTQLTA